MNSMLANRRHVLQIVCKKATCHALKLELFKQLLEVVIPLDVTGVFLPGKLLGKRCE